MDWKPYYDAEWTKPGTAGMVERALDDAPVDDPEVDAALAAGAVSFPHTYLAASASMLARTVRGIARANARRVLALGVLHGGTAPDPFREPLTRYRAEVGADTPELRAIFERFGPAVTGSGALTTRFGTLPRWDVPGLAPADDALLAGEFSPDNFLNVLALDARRRGAEPPEVFPVYAGLTVSPSCGSERASALATALRAALRPGDVVVATGDIVHYGAFYGGPESTRGMPEGVDALTARFRARVEAMHAAAFAGDIATATAIAARELRSDQLFILPVLAALFGPSTRVSMPEFVLSDYADVLDAPPPCRVASALTAMVVGETA